MSEKVFLGGVTNTTMHLETDGTIHLQDTVDAEPILDFAAAGRDHRFSADACDGMLRHVAEVPMPEYMKWCAEAKVQPFTPAADIVMELKLRDPDNARMLAAPKVRDPRIIMRGKR